MSKKGRLIIISAPSGCGKSTVIQKILQLRPDYAYSISSTTREPRDYEIDGVNYHFLSHEEFQKRLENGEFVENFEIHGQLYGTERSSIQKQLNVGHNVLLDIDVNGGEAIRDIYPDSILIFLEPPSTTELKKRLIKRGTDDKKAIERRLSRYPMELEKGNKYPHKVVNDDLEQTVKEVLKIIDSNRNI